MNEQITFTDLEYSNRRRTTRREEFLRKMDSSLPWQKWVEKLLTRSYP